MSETTGNFRAGADPAVDQEVSRAIAVARVICIFFVMYVHVWPGQEQFDPGTHGVRGIDHFYRFMTTVLGHSSVPLLSMVSGYLLAGSYGGDWRQLLSARASTLLLPLVAWNLLMIAALLSAAALGLSDWQRPATLPEWADAVLAWRALSANMPISFLRDLFVCIALAPLLLPLLGRRRLVAVAAIVAAIAFSMVAPVGVPLVRPMILPFFLIGAAMRRQGVAAGGDLMAPAALAAAAAVAVAIFVVDGQNMPVSARGLALAPAAAAKSMLLRLAVAYLFWGAALRLSAGRIGEQFRRLEPYVFFVFCSHAIIIKLIAVPGSWIFGGYYSPVYPLFFLLQPVMALMFGIAAARQLVRWAPGLLRPLNAGRLAPASSPFATTTGDARAISR